MELREDAEGQATVGLGIMRRMAPGSVYMTNWTSSWYSRYAAIREGDRGIHIQTTDYWTMGFEQAADILASGRRLYLQRSTPDYEAAYTVEPRWGVIFRGDAGGVRGGCLTGAGFTPTESKARTVPRYRLERSAKPLQRFGQRDAGHPMVLADSGHRTIPTFWLELRRTSGLHR